MPDCDNTVRTTNFTDVISGEVYPIESFINCNSSYVMYRLECECGHFYFGQTKTKLRLRVSEHKYAIRMKNMLYLMVRHFNEAGHASESSLKVMGIESIPCSIRGGFYNEKLSGFIHLILWCCSVILDRKKRYFIGMP